MYGFITTTESLWDRYYEKAFEILIEANENVPDLTVRSPAYLAARAANYADAMMEERERRVRKEERDER